MDIKVMPLTWLNIPCGKDIMLDIVASPREK